MIKQLVIILYLLSSLLLFSACTFFGSGSYEENLEQEDYYGKGEDEGELPDPDTAGEIEDPDSKSEDVDSDTGMYDDIEYIDEEDEDLLEEPTGIVEDDPDDPMPGEMIGGEEEIDDYPKEASLVADSEKPLESSEIPADNSSNNFFQNTSSPAPPPVKKRWVSYKKIKSQPYNIGDFLINAVYIARQGEDIQSVSNKIFGSDQISQLYAVNPHLKARNLKVGDKIYYPSPNRPQDSSQLLFYFEDNGISPEYHQIQAGENIRTVASKLLGHANSWKEIWATNPDLKSKTEVKIPLSIKYWPPTPVVTTPPPVQPQQPPSEEIPDTTPPPPPIEEGDEGKEDIIDEPPLQKDIPPTPLPGEDEIPDSSDDPEQPKKITSDFLQMDMILAGIFILGAVICFFIIMKKRRKKKEFDYTAANFEIDE